MMMMLNRISEPRKVRISIVKCPGATDSRLNVYEYMQVFFHA